MASKLIEYKSLPIFIIDKQPTAAQFNKMKDVFFDAINNLYSYSQVDIGNSLETIQNNITGLGTSITAIQEVSLPAIVGRLTTLEGAESFAVRVSNLELNSVTANQLAAVTQEIKKYADHLPTGLKHYDTEIEVNYSGSNYLDLATGLNSAMILVDGRLKTNADAIAQEIIDRGTADTTLQNNINAEAEARDQAIALEASARDQAISVETTNRGNAIEAAVTLTTGQKIYEITLEQITGPQGLQGIQGIQGATGAQGIQGPVGNTGLTGATGPQGIQGPQGTSVTILGSYASEAALNIAHPTGNAGESYIVLGDLYVWNSSAWENVGTIQGPTGPQGIQGPVGNTGLTGPQGIQGPIGLTGDQGVQGEQGLTGAQGEQGLKGDRGDDLGFLWSGTSLGVNVNGGVYTYVDLKGDSGQNGDSLGFQWNGTLLGINVNGGAYTEVDLKGETGNPGDPTLLIDDTAGNGETALTWSANKIFDQLATKQGTISANTYADYVHTHAYLSNMGITTIVGAPSAGKRFVALASTVAAWVQSIFVVDQELVSDSEHSFGSPAYNGLKYYATATIIPKQTFLGAAGDLDGLTKYGTMRFYVPYQNGTIFSTAWAAGMIWLTVNWTGTSITVNTSNYDTVSSTSTDGIGSSITIDADGDITITVKACDTEAATMSAMTGNTIKMDAVLYEE